MDRVEGPRRVPRPARSRPGCAVPARPGLLAGRRPPAPGPGPGAPSRQRALGLGSAPSAARGREGTSHPRGLEPKQVKVRAGHAHRYPGARPRPPARPACLPRALDSAPLGGRLPLRGLGGVSAGAGCCTQAKPGSLRAARAPLWSPGPRRSPVEPAPPGCLGSGGGPRPWGYSPELHVEDAKAEKHGENPLAKVSVHDPGRGAAP